MDTNAVNPPSPRSWGLRGQKKKRDLEALQANPLGFCGSESIRVRATLSVLRILEVPWTQFRALALPTPDQISLGPLHQLLSTMLSEWEFGETPEDHSHPLQKCTQPQPTLLDQDSAEPQWDPVLCIRDHPPRLPAQLSGLSTYQLREAAKCFRPELEKRWWRCGPKVGSEGSSEPCLRSGSPGLLRTRAG